MAQFLTKQKLRSKRFVKNEMFKCVRLGSENPTNRNWMNNEYISKEIENGVKLGLRNSYSLLSAIKPFTEDLFRSTFYHRNSINSDYALGFKIELTNDLEVTQVGEFFYLSNRNPFIPEMEGEEVNSDLFRDLDQWFIILVTTRLFRLNSLELVSPKPLEKTFKFNQCVICLDRKPDVLFINCNHTCVCKECEKMHPSTQCPYCRTEISKRLLI